MHLGRQSTCGSVVYGRGTETAGKMGKKSDDDSFQRTKIQQETGQKFGKRKRNREQTKER